MLLAVCDIETSGLNPGLDQVLEVAVVLWDTEDTLTGVEDLPTFHCLVDNVRVCGAAYALAMNAGVLRRIAAGEGVSPEQVSYRLLEFFKEHAPESIVQGRAGVTFGGRSFDLQFLKGLRDFNCCISPSHRSVDPGTLYFDPRTDDSVPGMDECARRAGLFLRKADGTFGDSITTKHDACRIVVELLRRRWAS